ncbi:MAG: hypothetical protein A2268_05525 [Candidatus Raymondbacteria bacterium RifOxyA12_full_50_37]|uniref:M23ase beta-sheet core domain-containing protein n=1 Tax=Candidatus Raymondbacteria bacterium RIFOXYD12_FULL_49_13 TaxID=1817890 RepID=A0A1F7FC33_UNCRA|nr:MAG: hypothetical protein A2268_05525 [Candidatus Raymondbacteria bacterium RifOxyA12_full_50_37]OGJ89024.1 MAG: hypothetical protein A2248_02760 [Candidatus Raymondbacteria bacterium RIFOXYA2_FULL_49_16]OGJ97051.1 MAG: hypothetical protein A2453_04175 [Candidatus Raymondbacteria bacterium RIFOXYC2_FULL_50_21]OGK02737.1 MAG: hypothetical protein A2487_01020 [Candidatus Raymondbacteria bacterium RifOxyC12_full_50_8]OGK04047.1 MAG: hypothetical protein A2519_00915 [Candidatus Raymondbacteria b
MKKFSFLVVPHKGGPVKEFRLSPLAMVLLILVFLFGLFSIYLAFKGMRLYRKEKNALVNLYAENKKLGDQLTGIRSKVAVLKNKISILSSKEMEIRDLADITNDSDLIGYEAAKSQNPDQEAGTEGIDSSLAALATLSQFYDSLVAQFGINRIAIDFTPTIRPIAADAYISAKFGLKKDPFSGEVKPHLGVDFSKETGAPVLAAASGIVSFAGKEKGFGSVVRIIHGQDFETMYAHLNTIGVVRGQAVRKGQQIATLGNTGRSIGPHLHYEVIKDGKHVDPEQYF